jgi:hypothetical protein
MPAHFGVNGTSTGFGLTNEKSGGSALVSVGAVSEIGVAPGPGRTQNTSDLYVSYANGTSPASSTSPVSGANAGMWNVQTGYGGAATNAGLSFTINFNQAISSGDIYVGVNDYNDSGLTPTLTFTAALSGGNTETAAGTNGLPNSYDVYDIKVSNIDPGSTLTLSYVMSVGQAADNVSLSGVAFDLVEAPEPSTYALLGLGLVALFAMTRIRRQVR